MPAVTIQFLLLAYTLCKHWEVGRWLTFSLSGSQALGYSHCKHCSLWGTTYHHLDLIVVCKRPSLNFQGGYDHGSPRLLKTLHQLLQLLPLPHRLHLQHVLAWRRLLRLQRPDNHHHLHLFYLPYYHYYHYYYYHYYYYHYFYFSQEEMNISKKKIFIYFKFHCKFWKENKLLASSQVSTAKILISGVVHDMSKCC